MFVNKLILENKLHQIEKVRIVRVIVVMVCWCFKIYFPLDFFPALHFISFFFLLSDQRFPWVGKEEKKTHTQQTTIFSRLAWFSFFLYVTFLFSVDFRNREERDTERGGDKKTHSHIHTDHIVWFENAQIHIHTDWIKRHSSSSGKKWWPFSAIFMTFCIVLSHDVVIKLKLY